MEKNFNYIGIRWGYLFIVDYTVHIAHPQEIQQINLSHCFDSGFPSSAFSFASRFVLCDIVLTLNHEHKPK